jgi:hypothetical protein
MSDDFSVFLLISQVSFANGKNIEARVLVQGTLPENVVFARSLLILG